MAHGSERLRYTSRGEANMILQPDGDFQLQPAEVVTITVTAVNTIYLAIFSRLRRAEWQILSPPRAVAPNQIQEVRRFQAGLAAPDLESTTILFDFVRDANDNVPNGAEYVVDLQGSLGPFRPRKLVLPVPPFPIDRHLVFEVIR
jgi:hypothetical protein